MRLLVAASSAAVTVETPPTSTRFSFSRNACKLTSAAFNLVRNSPKRLFIQVLAVADIAILASNWLSIKPLAKRLAALAAMRGSAISTCTRTSWLLPCGSMLMRPMNCLTTESKICSSLGPVSASRSSGKAPGISLFSCKPPIHPLISSKGASCWRGSNSGCVVRFNSLTTRSAKERDFSNSNCVSKYSLPLPSKP